MYTKINFSLIDNYHEFIIHGSRFERDLKKVLISMTQQNKAKNNKTKNNKTKQKTTKQNKKQQSKKQRAGKQACKRTPAPRDCSAKAIKVSDFMCRRRGGSVDHRCPRDGQMFRKTRRCPK